MKYYILNLLSVFAVLVAFMIYLCVTKANRYVPTITVTASVDGGETYTSNLKSLPRKKDIYLKYEVSVKAKGFWWRLFNKVICFTIEFPNEFKLYDYTGKEDTNQKKNFANSAAGDYMVTIAPLDAKEAYYEVCVKAKGFGQRFFHNTIKLDKAKQKENAVNSTPRDNITTVISGTDIKETYRVNVSEVKKRTSFSVVASSAPKKAEIILKLPYQNSEYYGQEENRRLTLSFSSPVSNVYDKTITMDFAPRW
jgi:hypothetical protein